MKAKSLCDLFVLDKVDFNRILQDYPQFAEDLMKVAKERYNLVISSEELLAKK